MNKISVSNFNALFTFLNSKDNMVVWVRTLDYNKQLYVSPSFENVFGHSVNVLYETPKAFNELVLPNDQGVYFEKQKARLVYDDNQNDPYPI